MNVRIITTTSFPEGYAATNRIRCFVKAIIHGGNSVQVVAPSNVTVVEGKRLLHFGESEGAKYVLLANFSCLRNGLYRYLWQYGMAWWLLLYTVFTVRQGDVYIVDVSTSLTRFLIICWLKVCGKKVAIELNEYPYMTDGSRLSKLPFVRPFLRAFFFRVILRSVDGAFVISRNLEKTVAFYAPNVKTLRVPILVIRTQSPIINSVIRSDNIYLFHAGTLSEQKDGISAVFEAYGIAYQMLREKYGIKLQFLLTNKVAYAQVWNNIERILEKYDCANEVKVTGFCDELKLENYLRNSLALVINKPSNTQNLHNFPTKLGDYLSSGRPVIVAAEEMEINEFVTDNFDAIVCRPNDSRAIAAAVVKCFESSELSERIAKNGIMTAIKCFDVGNHASAVTKFLVDL